MNNKTQRMFNDQEYEELKKLADTTRTDEECTNIMRYVWLARCSGFAAGMTSLLFRKRILRSENPLIVFSIGAAGLINAATNLSFYVLRPSLISATLLIKKPIQITNENVEIIYKYKTTFDRKKTFRYLEIDSEDATISEKSTYERDGDTLYYYSTQANLGGKTGTILKNAYTFTAAEKDPLTTNNKESYSLTVTREEAPETITLQDTGITFWRNKNYDGSSLSPLYYTETKGDTVNGYSIEKGSYTKINDSTAFTVRTAFQMTVAAIAIVAYRKKILSLVESTLKSTDTAVIGDMTILNNAMVNEIVLTGATVVYSSASIYNLNLAAYSFF